MTPSLPNGAHTVELDVTERFAELVARPEAEIALDEAALLIAAHAHPDLDVDARLAQLDRPRGATAARLPTRQLAHAAVRRARASRGNADRLRRPAQLVPRRRARPPPRHPDHAERADDRGRAAAAGSRCTASACPATSSSAAARASGSIRSTGAPGSTSPGCAALLRGARTPAGRSVRRSCCRSGPLAIVERMLGNLQHTLMQRDPARCVWVAELRLRIPGISLASRVRARGLLGRLGQFAGSAALDACRRALRGARRPRGEGCAEQAARVRRERLRRAPTDRALGSVARMAQSRSRCSRSAPCCSRTRVLPLHIFEPRYRGADRDVPPRRRPVRRRPDRARLRGRRRRLALRRRHRRPHRRGRAHARRPVPARHRRHRTLPRASGGSTTIRIPRAEIDVIDEPKRRSPPARPPVAPSVRAAARPGAGDERGARRPHRPGRRRRSSTHDPLRASFEAAALAPDRPARRPAAARARRPVRSASTSSRSCSTTRPRCSSCGSPEAELRPVGRGRWTTRPRTRRTARTDRASRPGSRGSIERVPRGVRASENDDSSELADYDQHPADTATETFEREKDLVDPRAARGRARPSCRPRWRASTTAPTASTRSPASPSTPRASTRCPTARTNIDPRRATR